MWPGRIGVLLLCGSSRSVTVQWLSFSSHLTNAPTVCGSVLRAQDRRNVAETRGQLDVPGRRLLEPPTDLPVEAHIGPAEAIDGLLRIAHDEQLAASRCTFPPGAHFRVGSCEQQKNIDLK